MTILKKIEDIDYMMKEDTKEITESTALRVIYLLDEHINENLYKKRKYYFGNR